jgi:hypothetical protein
MPYAAEWEEQERERELYCQMLLSYFFNFYIVTTWESKQGPFEHYAKILTSSLPGY